MTQIISIATIVLVFAVACSSGTGDSTTVPLTTFRIDSTITEPHEATQPDSDSISVPDELEFKATLIGGGTIDAVSRAGPDVFLWFWTQG